MKCGKFKVNINEVSNNSIHLKVKIKGIIKFRILFYIGHFFMKIGCAIIPCAVTLENEAKDGE